MQLFAQVHITSIFFYADTKKNEEDDDDHNLQIDLSEYPVIPVEDINDDPIDDNDAHPKPSPHNDVRLVDFIKFHSFAPINLYQLISDTCSKRYFADSSCIARN